MTCSFDVSSCSPQCKKYSLCAYFNLQIQIKQLQEQTNTLLKVVSTIGSVSTKLDEKIEVYTKDMLDLISYMNESRERQDTNEI